MIIRKAALNDLELIYEMEKRIFNDSWTKEAIEDELKRKRHSLNLIAEVNGIIIGYFFAHLVEGEAHILNIAIDIPFQHQGRGNQFLDQILENYLQYADVYLEVKRSNFPAINLYLNFGFEEIDIRNEYYSDGEDAVIMVKKVKTHGLVSSKR
ncbi:MAG: ribosomal protein S18-alanine N-acetyltransferase [Candidatus Marinimicrobia bacterium]|nr:ribosomal protein S18-alanine N-acetyltransferase [Candidatus Neomarinimicrobiota bacterium]MBL7030358.1 ribosomal protein S18-alanine N-acetyltransferase [Candidatus Neomarinimicrobiota bacterium]